LKKTLKYLSAVAALALVTGVAVAPASHAAKIKACVVLDTGGVDDHSFNAGAWAGAQSTSAIADVSYLPSSSAADFAPNIKKFLDQKCAIIIGVGFSISGEIVKAGKANPGTKFATPTTQFVTQLQTLRVLHSQQTKQHSKLDILQLVTQRQELLLHTAALLIQQ